MLCVMRFRILRPFLLVLCLAAPLAPAAADGLPAAVMQRMAGIAEAAGSSALTQTARRFYTQRHGAPLWLDGAAGERRLAAGLSVLSAAAQEGLDPADYATGLPRTEIAAALSGLDTAARARLEVAATLAMLRYAHDVSVGRSGPARIDPNVFAAEKTFDAGALLDRLADPATDPAELLRAMPPAHREYAGLRQALARYTALAERPEPAPVADGPALKPGMRDGRVAAMRARLAYFGDHQALAAEPDPELYTPLLAQAVRGFQARHGLETDAVAGAQTLGALNESLAARLDRIRLNMERWRWLPHDLGRRFVLVNIAAFQAEMVDGGNVIDTMRAVVGKTYRMTPVFSDRITYVEINPTWTVPPKIARKDLLPKIEADPAYLAEGGYKVFANWGADAPRVDPASIDWGRINGSFPYKLEQGPGPKNALGEVKIMFPNRFDVYMHDTPSRELFGRRVRAFSSGCIRLHRPFDMVNWLMRETGGPGPEEIEKIRESRETTVVRLPESVPVHIIYATAWTSTSGEVHFRPDIYDRDRLLAKSLAQR